MRDDAYTPIDCSLHDELLLLALRRREVRLAVRSAEAADEEAPERLRGRVVDVLTRDGAEWLVLESGRRIRLDRLVTVDGRAFPGP